MSSKKQAQLYCAYYAQDDPKKNTAVKLSKFDLVKMRKSIHQCPRNAIVLDPFSPHQLSIEDRDQIIKYGLVVVDCSWNQIEKVFKTPFQWGRSLPNLLAANSINYGKWGRLSSAEALAAALEITEFKDQARELLSKFKWGAQFWELNF